MCPVEDEQLIIFLGYRRHGIEQMHCIKSTNKVEGKLFFSLQSFGWCESKWFVIKKRK